MAGTIFFPSKHPALSEIISLSTSSEARESVHKLFALFNRGDRKKRVLIKRAAVLAATRAGVMANNKRLELETREEKAEVEEIYRRAYSRMII